MSEAEIITGARAFLRANLSGTIGFDEEFIPIKIVVAPDGALVAPVMVAMLRALDVVVFLPEEDDAAMQLQVTLEEIEDKGEHAALCDRWRIYHGEPEDVRWARISIDAAKFDGRMFDGLALMHANALAEAERLRAGAGHVAYTFPVPELDALAVLETLDEPAPRGYFENPSRQRAHAAGAPVAQSPGGPDPKATPRAAGPPGTVPVNLPVEFTISRSSLCATVRTTSSTACRAGSG